MKRIILIIALLSFASCDGGLEPPRDKSFLKGKIIFAGGANNWPAVDSIFGVRVAAFRSMPNENILNDIINGNAYFTLESLPMFVDTAEFEIEIDDAPVDLVYIVAVIQNALPLTAQIVGGVYNTSGDFNQPAVLNIEKGRTYDIEIEVDFDDLPPMPF